MSRSIPWESPNGLESSEDRGSAGRHGNQHVRLRFAQVRPQVRLTTCRGFDGNHRQAVVVSGMRARALTFWTIAACTVALAPACVSAEEGFDTEHIFGFMIGTDVGNPGEREFQTQTTGRFGKGGGTYRALSQEVEIEAVPLPNFRVEVGGTATLHDITGVPDIGDRRQFNFQGASLDVRYRLLDRERAPFGLTVAAELPGDRIDEACGANGRMYGTDFTLAFDRELIPNFATRGRNLIYQPQCPPFEVDCRSEKS